MNCPTPPKAIPGECTSTRVSQTRLFYLVATNIGGQAWKAPGHIWYESLKASTTTTGFQEFAETTVAKAGQLYGVDEQRAVQDAWEQVGIGVRGCFPGRSLPPPAH